MWDSAKKCVFVLAFFGLACLTGCNGARDTALRMGESTKHTGFLHKTLVNEGRSRQYAVFIPHNYSPDKKWPAIVFLHGIGEAGSDVSGPLRVGLAPFVADRADNFPFIVIFPQSTGGWDPNSDAARDAIAIIEKTKQEYSVDADRISLTGLSTGGYGTFAIGAKYSYEFAALAPMCPSGGDTSDGPILAKMNIWAFENAVDPFVMPASMASTLSSIRSAGGNPQHTVYGAFGHDCWETAYGDGAIFEWLQQQRRGGTAGSPPAGPSKTSASPANPITPAKASSSAAPVRPFPAAKPTWSNDQALVPSVY